MKSIVLYGLKSEKEAYVCSRYEILGCERMSVTDLLFTASCGPLWGQQSLCRE